MITDLEDVRYRAVAARVKRITLPTGVEAGVYCAQSALVDGLQEREQSTNDRALPSVV